MNTLPIQIQPALPTQSIERFCRKWRIADLTINQSAANSADHLSFIVRFDVLADWALVDRIQMQTELQDLLGVNVTLQTRHAALIRDGRLPRMHVLYNA